ncbi:glycosyltransferase [Breoghania sp.]|uniref:glycosyltransferase n=1 Tax=Breoghania sp. TaxID=2065378 RepID=UPI002AA95A1B|nr:glycosyltransferase [Breoghania sp.]
MAFDDDAVTATTLASGSFDAEWYLEAYPDVRALGMDPLEHYIRFGEILGRSPGPKIAEARGRIETTVRGRASMLSGKKVSAHAAGRCAPVSPGDRRLTEEILKARPSATDVDQDVAIEEIKTSGLFDADYYLAHSQDVAGAGLDPIEHYVRFGEREGRKPCADFDACFYFSTNADVCSLVANGFAHYVVHGRHEGRYGYPQHHVSDDATFGEPILLVGHDALLAGAERVLLEFARWLKLRTKRPVTVYLMVGGQLTPDFCELAEVIAAPDDPELERAVRREILKRDWGAIYLNTVVSGKFLKDIEPEYLEPHTFVGHIHEMSGVLAEYEDLLRPMLSRCSHLISASPLSTKALVETYGHPPERISTSPPFILPVVEDGQANAGELRQLARGEFAIGNSARVVMGCGTVDARKGTDIFIETAIAVNAKAASANRVYFIWVGDGPDRARLEARVAKAGLEKWIRITGTRMNAARLLAASDLFLLSSREDPFPLVCMEAAQHCSPSLFVEGTTGIADFVTPPGKAPGGVALKSAAPKEIAAEILALFANPEKIRELGQTACDRVFAHYVSEQGCFDLLSILIGKAGLAPVVSAIVPNYNHADYLSERLGSILGQTYRDYEIIVLDDASTDASLEVIESAVGDVACAKIVPNEENSGNVFRQWAKGLSLARGEFSWIAESDDWCDETFLARLIDLTGDERVVIAAGRTIPYFEGAFDPAPMDAYLNQQCPGLFDKPFVLEGDAFVNDGMGAACLLVNASGLIMRTGIVRLYTGVGENFRMAGDWATYLHILRHGRVAYTPKAENYFRRHAGSTVHKLEGTPTYFDERRRIAALVYELFPVGQGLDGRMRHTLQHELDRFAGRSGGLTLSDIAPDRTPTLRARRKVAFYVHGMAFSRGGIERLAAQLASHLAVVGFEVHILCRRSVEAGTVYPLHARVSVAQVFADNQMEASIREVHTYLVENGIEVFVPMLSEWLFTPLIEAGYRAGVKIIASEHNDPWQIEARWWSREERQQAFQRADRVHLLSANFAQSLDPDLRDRVAVIPNGVDLNVFRPVDDAGEASEEGAARTRTIVAVGRLAEQKRMDVLIRAFSAAKLAEQGWRLEIYGEGELRLELQDLIEEAGLSHAAALRGLRSDMDRVFQRASLSVVPSDFEGFGIVVVESLACGTPVVAFADCNGPNEIIVDGECGALVKATRAERAERLAEELSRLCASPDKLADMAHACRNRAHEYALDKFFERWEALIDGV